jgi:O-antigen ligase
MLRSLTLFSLLVHLVSLAATQTAYGAGFSMLRWYSLFALTSLGGLHWLTGRGQWSRSQSVEPRVVIYLCLWGLTVVNAEYVLFSGYRWAAHAMIVVSALVFLPGGIRPVEAPKALLVLKMMVAAILITSYFRPVRLTVFDNHNWYRGILGNANSMGEMAAVGCLLFLHGFLTKRSAFLRYLHAMLAGLAAFLMFQSGARSAVVAFLGGFIALYFLYSRKISRYVGFVIVATVIAIAVLPNVQQRVGAFIMKHSDEYQSGGALASLLFSHQGVWERSWEGFKERPSLGWGFGEDSSSNLSAWNGELTALGYAQRDPVNDILYSLETGGIVGLIAYLLIATLIFEAWIPARVRSRLDVTLDRRGYEPLVEAYDVQRAYCCTTILLIVLFEFDNTALSAGNFFAALLWISLGQSLGLSRLLMHGLAGVAAASASLPQHAAKVPA